MRKAPSPSQFPRFESQAPIPRAVSSVRSGMVPTVKLSGRDFEKAPRNPTSPSRGEAACSSLAAVQTAAPAFRFTSWSDPGESPHLP